MSSGFLPILCFLSVLILTPTTIAQQTPEPPMLYKDCVGKGNYTTNSTYHTNLNTLLTSIYTNTQINYGFYNFSYGQGPDTVYAIALCRPDILPDSCRACIRNASDSLTTICRNFKEAIGGQDDCMVRYANRSIFNLMEGGPYFWVYNDKTNVSDVDGFNRSRTALLDRLRDEAAAGNSRYKYAMNQTSAPNIQTIYGLAQCTPDLSESECRYCLYNASGLIPQCCEARDGGRVIFPSCNFRYEITRFYDPSVVNSTQPGSGTPPTGQNSNTSRTVIAVVVPVIISVALALSMYIFIRQRNLNRGEEINDDCEMDEDMKSLQFDFGTIQTATDDFFEANMLGRGGFGDVYKGTLPNGQIVAVKRLSRQSEQGDVEFKNEILLVSKLQHRNLVRILGFCFEREERLLVYEFVPNSSLNNFVFDPTKRADLGWETRFKIIEGIARGLLYLHEDSRLRIIHRDLKASNILLDEEMNPKISDFGMARMFAIDQTQDDTSRIVGTFGYMAPEYITRGHFSIKSDVFSFGVLVLEIVSGQRNSSFRIGGEEEDLLSYAWRSWIDEGKALNIIDPVMREGSRSEMVRCIHIALLCVQEKEAHRPTMDQVGTMLSSYSLTLPVPLKPAFVAHSALATGSLAASSINNSLSDASRNNDNIQQSNNEASLSDILPR